jgi:signal peptidase I
MPTVKEMVPDRRAPPMRGASASGKEEFSLLRWLGELLQTLVIAGVLFVGVSLATARVRVEGNSMEPGLHDGDLVLVNRLAYRIGEPQRGDVIIFYYPFNPEKRYIKRIIGLPGDTVTVRDGQLLVNGAVVEEPYIAAPPEYSGTWVVGPNEVFVLGDNRNNSEDSTDWGMLPMEEIIGKAVLVYWPPLDLGWIPHYNLFAEAAQ